MHENSTKNAKEVAAELRKGLATLVRAGSATASDFVFETPEVLHTLRERGAAPTGAPLEVQMEETLLRAIDKLPSADAAAARIMFGVDPDFRATRLGERREHAAAVLGVAPGTFRNRHEDRLLDSLSQEVTLALLSAQPSIEHREGGKGRDRSRVLLIHGRDSIGVKEVAKLVERLGLEPILWQEALDRIGLLSPSMIERFRSCLDVAQGVIVVLEGGLGESALNLVFEAGLALGLAEERTVVVQLGDQTPPDDLAAVDILRLRSTEESANALSSALASAGCTIPGPSTEPTKGIDAGWYRWTPENAADPVYADIAEAVRTFQPISYPAGDAAAEWLSEKALERFPGITTYLCIADGRLEGFVALEMGSIVLRNEKQEGESFGAVVIRWMARHRDAPGTGEDLLVFAIALATEVGEKLGAAALVLQPFDAGEAAIWVKKFHFRKASESDYLWMPLSAGLTGADEGDVKILSPRSAEE